MWEKPQVFLSYAREDQIIIAKLYRKLTEAGLRPWMDVEDIAPGEDWRAAIDKAIETSSVFLACLSPRSAAKAGMLREEMELARNMRAKNHAPLRMIPVRIEPCDAPEALKDLQWIDLNDPDGWDRLLRAAKPRRSVRAPVFGAAALVLLLAGAFWIGQRPCDFAAARAVAGCSSAESMVGATFWRLRPAVNSDPPAVRSIIQPPPGDGGPATEWTPVRLTSGDQLTSGDRFYVSIESAGPGYLYVVDREQYANGHNGAPELIFPTLRTRRGNNQVEKDALVRLPSADDKPPYFQVTQGSAAGYQGEIFTVILLPKPITGFVVPDDHSHVEASQFASWQKAWERSAAQVPGKGGSQPITEAEARAHRAPTETVQTPDDPSPQLVYRVTPGTDGGMWVNFRLSVRH
jgi:hypothetical protein